MKKGAQTVVAGEEVYTAVAVAAANVLFIFLLIRSGVPDEPCSKGRAGGAVIMMQVGI